MIKDLIGTTLVDYPGRIASTVFIAGCNFRCPFCHNAELVFPEIYNLTPNISNEQTIAYLKKRMNFISGVVFTGGEPLLYKDLEKLIREIKSLGLKVKLDTNGSFPGKLSKIIELVDYIAMDIKTSPSKYPVATGSSCDFSKILESIELVQASSVEYEFRTTAVPKLVESQDIREIGKIIKGSTTYALQTFTSENTLDEQFAGIPIYPPEVLEKFKKIIEPQVDKVIIR
ncbi:MAG: anaerobic ribonucleoside-triphosphate reductase activating protein [Deltaproteobacteria bacterium]|jgi:pyruvate formate lyase activating enzyme|nr:anaerobic ribonucleoside-triphosphate reductase activating protein [Deltaproteobacteria bacterium]